MNDYVFWLLNQRLCIISSTPAMGVSLFDLSYERASFTGLATDCYANKSS
jgi:hypothetical protein